MLERISKPFAFLRTMAEAHRLKSSEPNNAWQPDHGFSDSFPESSQLQNAVDPFDDDGLGFFDSL